ncbi:MAG: flagellar hook-associated protein FlgK [Pseudomonadota bacterium]
MTLSSALSNALSGMTAAARSTDVISSNIANANTEGYRLRELEVTSRFDGSGGGVRVIGVTRHIDLAVQNDRRAADAELQDIGTQASFLAGVQSQIGLPSEEGSLSDRLANLDAALTGAIGRPESDSRLASVVDALHSVTEHLATISDHVQTERSRADKAISKDIDILNDRLAKVEDLNGKIRRLTASGEDVSSLLDQRQDLVDQIAEIVPVQELDRGFNMIALMTPQGGLLIDGSAVELNFTPASGVTAQLNVGAGTLSGIDMNGFPVNLDREPHILSGGRLGANLMVRDTIGPEAQAKLDAFARDLIERFADPTVDPTLGATDAGLFTDDGNAFDPVNELGLASRIAVNDTVDPENGGDYWYLRDGLLAAAQGPIGDATGLIALRDALNADRVPVSGGFSGAARSGPELAADMLSEFGSALQSLEASQAFAEVQRNALSQIELQSGVDTDQEMQKLLLIEQAYAANARVIQTVDALFEALLRI